MTEKAKSERAVKLAKDLNVGVGTILEVLKENGFKTTGPSTKVTPEGIELLYKEFQKDYEEKLKAEKINLPGNLQAEEKEKQVEKPKETDVAVEDDDTDEDDKSQPEVTVQDFRHRTEEAETKEKKAEEEPKEEVPKEEEPKTEEKAESDEVEEKEEVKAEEEKKSEKSSLKVVGKVELKDEKEEKKKKATAKKKKEDDEKATKKAAEEEEKDKTEKTKKAKAKKEEESKKEEEEKAAEEKAKKDEASAADGKHESEKVKLTGTKVIGKINVEEFKREKTKKPEDKKDEDGSSKRKRKRKRISRPVKASDTRGRGDTRKGQDKKQTKDKAPEQPQVSEKEIEDKIKDTLARITGGGKGKASRSKLKKLKREQRAEAEATEEETSNVLEVTEFVSVSELAAMMDVTATDVISKCMGLGIIVSINQRLDAEVIELVADEFEYEVKFIDITEKEVDIEEEDEDPADLVERAPIVTIMGHVDHGKTSLLDHVREENVVAGEAGGITQHIGAYEVLTKSGKKVVFLDTPGHEAFTAMRARGAKATDVAVIVIAADDSIMPQTKEAISHAQAAGVPMIFAINKIDKDNANPEKIKEQLAQMNLLVEDWGGKYQSQEISAKKGINIEELLEKILLESELLELKANPDKKGKGIVIEASLDKGRGYLATILVQEGNLKQGDYVISGSYHGRVKAMFNERGERKQKAGPSTPVQILGLNGAPQAGEILKVANTEQEAKSVAQRRLQIEREQGMRTKKHITLDEIGRRLALGTFKELNVIVKGDVDGSIEALADSLLKLSTSEIQVNIVHRAVGQITESDVLLASASDAIIIGFQVRPSLSAKKLAQKENIEIRLYSVIYDAIEEIKTAMEGMLEPKIEEKINGYAEVKEVFKITKVGTVAGCQVAEGKIIRGNKLRLVREGIVIYDGEMSSLKRFKDDVKEAVSGQECGIGIKDYNDIKVGDMIEAYEETEVKRTL